MYHETQHRDLFDGPGDYLFRGALPSEAFAAPYRGPGVTPTSVDPVVATLFACRYSMDGPAFVFAARKADFAGLLDGPNLASFWYELAVNLDLPPDAFEARCRRRVPVADSVAVLASLGYELPPRLPDHGALTLALTESRKMAPGDVARYVERCHEDPRGG